MEISLRAARVNAGLTQQDVCDQTGFARSTIRRWERGETKPGKRAMEVLCRIYGVSADQIGRSTYGKR